MARVEGMSEVAVLTDHGGLVLVLSCEFFAPPNAAIAILIDHGGPVLVPRDDRVVDDDRVAILTDHGGPVLGSGPWR
ncbi:hypothetical protein [Herbidospora mongoliensis]|uniref:hypothetical protein n=1 Tax=Herbidospora mongoliensis TaxID=688067 RepID=UPI000A871EFC|nr:hypothetical protein [Herbidospora mongoliensis]